MTRLFASSSTTSHGLLFFPVIRIYLSHSSRDPSLQRASHRIIIDFFTLWAHFVMISIQRPPRGLLPHWDVRTINYKRAVEKAKVDWLAELAIQRAVRPTVMKWNYLIFISSVDVLYQDGRRLRQDTRFSVFWYWYVSTWTTIITSMTVQTRLFEGCRHACFLLIDVWDKINFTEVQFSHQYTYFARSLSSVFTYFEWDYSKKIEDVCFLLHDVCDKKILHCSALFPVNSAL